MPKYNYQCHNCGYLELELKMSDIPIKECPKCKGKEIERIFESINSIWKTTGAYSKTYHRDAD